ncbi:MAG: arginine deiminase-related protein [Sphingomicrobium sp.]
MTEEEQTSGSVLLVRPRAFAFHAEAAATNAFAAATDADVAERALAEFDALATALDGAGVETVILERDGPDAVFPNNWVSFHGDGTMVLYPMATAARRLERDTEALLPLLDRAGFAVKRTVDLTGHERHGRFLEGTGSLILDRPRAHAFASRSVRTDAAVIADFDAALGYSTLLFDALDRADRPIYHTNVLLSLGSDFAVLCSHAVPAEQRGGLIDALERSVIAVSFERMSKFACNIIELRGRSGPVIALSAAALESFTPAQRRQLEQFATLLPVPIPTVEAVGGGSVRCMIAEIHLPRR